MAVVFFRSCQFSRLCSLPIWPAGAISFATYSLSSAQSPGTVFPRILFSMWRWWAGGKSEGYEVVHSDITEESETYSQITIPSKTDFSRSFWIPKAEFWDVEGFYTANTYQSFIFRKEWETVNCQSQGLFAPLGQWFMCGCPTTRLLPRLVYRVSAFVSCPLGQAISVWDHRNLQLSGPCSSRKEKATTHF